MRYFTLLDFQHMILALFLGLIGVILVYVAWWQYPPPDREDVREPVQADHTGVSRSIPPILVFIIVGTLLAAFGYVLVVGIFGQAIS